MKLILLARLEVGCFSTRFEGTKVHMWSRDEKELLLCFFSDKMIPQKLAS
jgi:hypothetical protein